MRTPQENLAYYQRRLATCTAQAARTTCPSARHAYDELANLYRKKLDALQHQLVE
jgi:hypothetical protein